MDETFQRIASNINQVKIAKETYKSAMEGMTTSLDELMAKLTEDEGIKFINEDGDPITLMFDYSEDGAIRVICHEDW